MKTHLLIVVLLGFALAPAWAGVVSDIPPESRVVLKGSPGTWTPSPEQTKEILPVIQAFLERAQNKEINAVRKGEVKAVLTNRFGCRVQFWGDKVAGKRVIVCNFFPAERPHEKDEFAYWQKQPVVMEDGGAAFWQVRYDPATKTVLDFSANGEAMFHPVAPGLHLRFIAVNSIP